MCEKVPNEGVDAVIQKSSRSSGHQSSRHRTRDKSRDRNQERDRDKNWPPEKLSDSHSPVSVIEWICFILW